MQDLVWFFFIPTYYILNPNKYCLLLGKCHDKRAGPPSFSAYNFRSRECWSKFAKRSFNQQFGGKFELCPTTTTAIRLYYNEILIFWFLKKLYIKKSICIRVTEEKILYKKYFKFHPRGSVLLKKLFLKNILSIIIFWWMSRNVWLIFKVL